MKKNILLFLTSLLFFMADMHAQEWCEDSYCHEDTCCVSEKNFYAKIFGGANFLENTKITGNRTSYDTGYIIEAAFGYNWCYGLRVEGEYAFRRNEINKIHFFGGDSTRKGYFQTSSYMANLLWKIPLPSWDCECFNIEPFIGAGIGYDFQRMHASNCRIDFNQKWRHFSWQLMAGLAYPIMCNAELTLEYTFHQGGCHFNHHSLGVGFIYKFDFLR